LYGLVGHWLWQVYDRSVKYSAKSPLIVGSAFRSDLILASRRLSSLGSAIAVRRRHAEFYARSLKGRPVTLCAEPSSAFYNRYLFPILCASAAQRDAIAAELVSLGIDTSKPYKDIAQIAARYYGYTGDCPASEQVAERVLVVPNHEGLTEDHVTRISRAIAAAAGDEPSRLPAQQTRPAHV
jgi:dTDP-4-amino-4,6-dideoxygalactose transaminase